MRAAAVIVAFWSIAIAACGDDDLGPGLPLAPCGDLVLIAHQDDDLLFMQPDVIEAVQRGGGVTNVYVTAGNDNKGPGAANPRYQGLKEAYGAAAGDMKWDCGWIDIDGHLAQHCRLAAENVSLVFLAYPDGGEEGQFSGSLLELWNGTVASSTTVAERTATYDQAGLVATIAEIVRDVQPATIHTLDVTSNHGHDHVDHEIVGALALLALATTDQHPTVIAYRGYDTVDDPANKIQPIFDFVHPILGRYEACTSKCGAPCGQSCSTIDPTHDKWLSRRYAFGFRSAGAGVLQSGDTCVYAGGTLGECADAPVWTIDAQGELASPAGCLTAVADGSLAATECDGDPDQRWFVDDEGHVWSAVPPAPQQDMEFAHLNCLTPSGDGATARTALCGDSDRAPAWRIVPRLALTSHATTAIAATGRAVRLGDLTGDGRADLCTVTSGALACAPGDGSGHFGAAIAIGDLAIDPDSLAIGDVDGDGRPDACGRASSGTICALAASGFHGAPFSPAFGDADARAATSSSIAIEDDQICGTGATSVACTPSGTILSSWPAFTSNVWPADLDGDHDVDWCATGSAGLSCGVAAEAGVTTDGVPWLFSFVRGGVVDATADDPALTALGDIDGDGKSDVCTVVGRSIECARSQGRGFGPLVPMLTVTTFPRAVWLGDLDGDGRDDICADLDDAIACALL
ncbi:MAG TPA: FG-GAP-like repeat-containing protein [Kofleriaceae bacterium]